MTQNGIIPKAIVKQFKDLQWSNIGLQSLQIPLTDEVVIFRTSVMNMGIFRHFRQQPDVKMPNFKLFPISKKIKLIWSFECYFWK